MEEDHMVITGVELINPKTSWTGIYTGSSVVPVDDNIFHDITLQFPQKGQSPETLSKLAEVLALKTCPTLEVEIRVKLK